MSTVWQAGHVTANGVKLHYHRTGGDKPPVVLAHGITDNGLCWTRLARALAARYDLVMYDARGHGLSDQPGAYLLADHVADLIALIHALDLRHPVVLGHSMGGANAPVVAARHPELVRALVLEDPHWPDEPEDETTYDLNAWRNAVAAEKVQSTDALLAWGRRANPEWDDTELHPWAEAKRQVDPDVVSWLTSRQDLNNWREVAEQIRCPTLLVTGDPTVSADVTVTPEVAKEATRLCPSLVVANLPGAGHSVRRDQFTGYIKAVEAFLDQVVLDR